MPEDVLFCWSGGKDSAMALHALQSARDYRVTALLTTVTEGTTASACTASAAYCSSGRLRPSACRFTRS